MNTGFRGKIIGTICILFVAGCASKQTRIDGHQYLAVDAPDSPKNAMLILASYSACEGNDKSCENQLSQRNELQEKLESCINRGIKRTNSHISLINPGEGASSLNSKQLAEGTHVDITDELNTGNNRKVDYLVSIGVKKSKSDKKTRAEIADASPGAMGAGGPIVVPPAVLWGVGQEWTKSAFIETRIFSADSGKLMGELSADLTKDAFWMLPVLTIIPLIPIGWSPNVESTSCEEMGEAMGRFFAGAGNDYLE